MELQEIKATLLAGGMAHRRNCLVCKSPISYVMDGDWPVLLSCRCRESGEPVTLPTTWDDIELLEMK